jgi:deoxyribonuclease IV
MNVKPDKLNFITAGMPLRTEPRNYENAFNVLSDMNLDGLEVEFVRGVNMPVATRQLVKKISQEKNMILTTHAPYYINLNSKEEEKVEASVKRIVETAKVANEISAYSIVYHAAFYMGNDKKIVFDRVKKQHEKIISELGDTNVWIRPETTGKGTQWGDLDEVINISKEFDKVLPCIDFSHLHARSGGKFNTYDDFCMILEKIGKEIGDYALENFHAHLAGIAYSDKGEKNHLELENSDMNYKDLLKALKKFNVKGAVVCESPNIEDDCKMIKEYYYAL